MRTAAELYDDAREDETAGRLARAASLCQQALRRSPDSQLRTRILVTLAYLDAERGDAAGGIERCEEVLADSHHRGVDRGRTYAQLGLLRMRTGDADRALEAFRVAIRLLPDEHAYLARLFLNRGNVYLQRSAAESAEADFERAREHAMHDDLHEIGAKALHNRGYARMLRGDLVGALEDMATARETLAPLSAFNLAVCDQDRAEVLLAAGLIEDAGEVLRNASRVLGRQQMPQQQGEAELVLARLLLVSGDHRGARRTARSAIRRFETHDSKTWALRARVTELAANLGLGEYAARTVAAGGGLADELDAAGFAEAATRSRLIAALVAVRSGDLADATRVLTRVRVTAAGSMSNRMLAARTRAELAIARNRRARARSHLRSALESLAEWQATFGNLDLQAASVIHGRSCALLGLECAVADGGVATLLEWTERARSLAGRLPSVRPPRDHDAAQLLTKLRALRAAGHPNRSEITALETAVRERLWRTSGGRPSDPVSVDELRARLTPSGGTYLAYFHTRERLYGFAVTPEQYRLVELAPMAYVGELLDGLPADLAMIATRTSASMHEVLVSSVRMRLARLAELTVAPFTALIGDGPVAMSTTGVLADLPWSLLPGLNGRELTVVRSATSWTRSPPPVRPLAPGFVAGPGVVRAGQEVRRAAKSWQHPAVLEGVDATADAVHALASRVDLLHIAAHGSHRAQNPLFSALQLADGPWFGYDIDHLEQVPSTVLLSACELGRSAVRGGRESIGMTVAWLHAGASCVIASPAPINDEVACEVLGRVHAALARGAAPAAALAEASEHGSGEPVPMVCFGRGW